MSTSNQVAALGVPGSLPGLPASDSPAGAPLIGAPFIGELPSSDLPIGDLPVGGWAADGLAAAMATEVARLANQYFSGFPGGGLIATAPPSPDLAPVGPVPTAGPAPAVALPPRVGPSAFSVGAGGGSSALTAPPVPGPLVTPPLVNSPFPKESDLRNFPAVISDATQISTPVALAGAGAPTSSDQPYFLQIAGLPGTAPTTPSSPVLPGSAPSPVASSAFPWPAEALGGEPGLGDVSLFPLGDPQLSTGDVARVPVVPQAKSDLPYYLDWGGPSPFVPTAEAVPAELPSESVPELSTSPRLFDPYSIKRDFPILRERVHGRPLVWLDNAATTQKPQAVIDRLSYFYEHENSNIHRAAHTLAARATDAYEGAREKVRRFINAPSAKEIIFVRGATEGINLVAQTWGRRNVGPDDEIVISWLEHHANIVCWQQLCAEKGAKLKVAPVDSRGQIILEEYEKLLGPRTRLVSFTQVSNALGTIVPAREMVEIAHRYGARVMVDGAQAVSHMRADVQALDCDFYCFSGHKIFAPTGIGAVFGKAEVLEAMPPWQGGGNMIADVTFEKTVYQPPPARFEAGTGNIADAVGLGAALDYVTEIGIENITRYEHELLRYATGRLAAVPGLRMIGTAAEKAGVLSFVLDGTPTQEVGAALDREGIAVRSGHHCAQPILRRFGVEATVRASLAPYNTCEDIDALVAALIRIQTARG